MVENPQVNAFCQRHQLDGETIVKWTEAQKDGDTFSGVAILTNRRLVLYRKGVLAEKFEPWPIERITSVESRRGLLLHEVKVHISGDDMQFRAGSHGTQIVEFVAALQEALHSRDAPAQTGQAFDQPDDPLATITKLKALLDAGALTEAEFNEQKAVQLARL